MQNSEVLSLAFFWLSGGEGSTWQKCFVPKMHEIKVTLVFVFCRFIEFLAVQKLHSHTLIEMEYPQADVLTVVISHKAQKCFILSLYCIMIT